jgi:hypothetical protein
MLSLSATQFATLQGFGLTKYEFNQEDDMSEGDEEKGSQMQSRIGQLIG